MQAEDLPEDQRSGPAIVLAIVSPVLVIFGVFCKLTVFQDVSWPMAIFAGPMVLLVVYGATRIFWCVVDRFDRDAL